MTSPADPATGRALARELLDNFAAAWSKAQIDKIVSIFNTDAVFQETPFAERLSGTDQIRRYWAEVPLQPVGNHRHYRGGLRGRPLVRGRVQGGIPPASYRGVGGGARRALL